jgi:hypothetical protein
MVNINKPFNEKFDHTATGAFLFKSCSAGSTTLPAKDDASFFKFRNFANLAKKNYVTFGKQKRHA